MIQVSQSASKKIKALRDEEGKGPEFFLRVQIKKGGCSGLSYSMSFEQENKTQDKIFEHFGERIAVDPESYMYLIGMTLDYQGGLNGKGFIFDNPNASKKCSCGTSFNVTMNPAPEGGSCSN